MHRHHPSLSFSLIAHYSNDNYLRLFLQAIAYNNNTTSQYDPRVNWDYNGLMKAVIQSLNKQSIQNAIVRALMLKFFKTLISFILVFTLLLSKGGDIILCLAVGYPSFPFFVSLRCIGMHGHSFNLKI